MMTHSSISDEDLIERLSEAAHEAWMESKRAQGVHSRNSEWGEDLMVPYSDLSELAKDLDRGTVRGVLVAIERAGLTVMERATALSELHMPRIADLIEASTPR